MRAFTLVDMRHERPTRDTLRRLIVEAKGNLTQVSAILGCSRPTLYKWIDQHDLRDFAGVRAVDSIDGRDGVDEVDEVDATHEGHRSHGGGKTRDKPQGREVIIFPDVETGSALPDTFRRQRSISMTEGLWRWARIEAARTDRRVADVVEAALELYRGQLAKKREALARKLEGKGRSGEE